VVIARATGYSAQQTHLSAIFEAIGDIGGVGVLGGLIEHRDQFERLPDYIQWHAWIPYEHLLPRAALFIHHGGTGTTHAAIRHGVRQIVIPESVDQFLHAERVMATNIGLTIRSEQVSRALLVKACETIFQQTKFRNGANKLQAQFASLGGIAKAAELLLNLAHRTES
jgi:UDP:flavonoid glycosyltransferase YjiC (YdhE family)